MGTTSLTATPSPSGVFTSGSLSRGAIPAHRASTIAHIIMRVMPSMGRRRRPTTTTNRPNANVAAVGPVASPFRARQYHVSADHDPKCVVAEEGDVDEHPDDRKPYQHERNHEYEIEIQYNSAVLPRKA